MYSRDRVKSTCRPCTVPGQCSRCGCVITAVDREAVVHMGMSERVKGGEEINWANDDRFIQYKRQYIQLLKRLIFRDRKSKVVSRCNDLKLT